MIPAGLPKLTLGWEVLEWGSTYLAHPDGKHMGDPWSYSDEQALFILWFYAIDEAGEFLYRNAVLERPKGWGKSPLLAAICCTEFMGPVRFGGFDAQGKPVGVPAPTPLVQIAAISDSQAENTYALCREMMLQGDIIDEFPDLADTVMLSKSTYFGRKLEKVTASPRGREGNRATFVVMDETHLWVPAVQGPELYDALARNLGKLNNRHIETTNAPVPGEGSVAELSHEAYDRMQSGEAFDNGLLFDTREINVEDIYDPESALEALEYVYGDAMHPETGWVNKKRIWAEINDHRTSEAKARRFYFNQRVRPASAWLNYKQWQSLQSSVVPRLKSDQEIAIGFKGATNKRAAAIVGFRISDGMLFNLGLWEMPIGAREQTAKTIVDTDGVSKLIRSDVLTWKAPWEEIDARMRNLMDNLNVVKVLVDPTHRRDITAEWHADYPKLFEEFYFTNRGKFAKTVSQFERLVEGSRIQWYDGHVSRHILNCHTEEVIGGQIIRQDKETSVYYISAAQAAVIAVEAAVLAVKDGALVDVDSTLYSW